LNDTKDFSYHKSLGLQYPTDMARDQEHGEIDVRNLPLIEVSHFPNICVFTKRQAYRPGCTSERKVE